MANITDVQITLPKDLEVDSKLRAYVNVVIDGDFIVRNLRIIEGPKGFFVVMPNRKQKDGSYQDMAHPLTNKCRRSIEDKVFEAYEIALQRNRSQQS